ncbi:hypothetical protein ABW19_dt0201467 [Dactylella cylindrospora]|nr:hypothetical protein ABW19_dt0201467 [Dactylella cylindrospora]
MSETEQESPQLSKEGRSPSLGSVSPWSSDHEEYNPVSSKPVRPDVFKSSTEVNQNNDVPNSFERPRDQLHDYLDRKLEELGTCKGRLQKAESLLEWNRVKLAEARKIIKEKEKEIEGLEAHKEAWMTLESKVGKFL